MREHFKIFVKKEIYFRFYLLEQIFSGSKIKLTISLYCMEGFLFFCKILMGQLSLLDTVLYSYWPVILAELLISGLCWYFILSLYLLIMMKADYITLHCASLVSESKVRMSWSRYTCFFIFSSVILSKCPDILKDHYWITRPF